MRPDPFDATPYDAGRIRYNHAPGDDRPAMPDFDAWREDGSPPPPTPGSASRLPRISMRWIMRGLGAIVVLLVIAIAWLAITAPLSQSLKPPTPP